MAGSVIAFPLLNLHLDAAQAAVSAITDFLEPMFI